MKLHYTSYELSYELSYGIVILPMKFHRNCTSRLSYITPPV